MNDLATARMRAIAFLASEQSAMNKFGSALPEYKDRRKYHLVITSELEFEFGWVFYYNTKEFLDTGDFHHALGGNLPLIFDRIDGELYCVPAAHSIKSVIAGFRNGIRTPAEQNGGGNSPALRASP